MKQAETQKMDFSLFVIQDTTLNPNRSLDRYSAIRYREDNFLPSSIFLLADCIIPKE